MPIQDKDNVFYDQTDGFGSSLIDTVKFRLRLEHEPLVDMVEGNPNLRRHGARFTVDSKFPGVRANVWSPADNQSLVIEASVAKFLTGQNVFGLYDLDDACYELGHEVLERLGLEIDSEVETTLADGAMELLRVDAAAHLKCESGEQAAAVMAALRRLAVTADGDWAAIKNETVTLGSWSRRRTFTIYRKDRELIKRPPSRSVWRRAHLLAAAENSMRFELSLAGQELRSQGVVIAHELRPWHLFEQLWDWFHRVAGTARPLPVIADIEGLPGALALRMRAWQLGDANAFAVAPSTRRQYRQRVLERTGIDINSPLSADEQREALKTVRDALVGGLTVCDRSDLWGRMKAGRRGLDQSRAR
ncbi:phage/plasmid replication protein, II/X family [Variovorax sp. OV700]|uniref:phage/plasmid replication protein, II/X family n=1 Tax=Variovorax sp. OV700 TaxID=1882826 RepID=UPI00088498A0|nr:phage/plasmid replication protein, II/X family [Variovorax sp. OV700]SDI16979.1 phage/plasmid replication protein, gene II/X family [Variovorax sp. OV700]